MKLRKLLIIIALIAHGSAGFLAADSESALTLEQAVATALENNHRIGAAEAGVEAAEAQLGEARAYRLPSLSLSGTISRTTNPVGVFGGLLGQERFGPEHFDPVFLNNPDALDNFGTMLSVEQPIYVGGKIASGIRAAENAREAAGSDQERARQLVVHQVIDGYSGAVLADRHLLVAREARKTTAAHVALVKDLFEGGLVVESDLLQAQVRASQVEEMVIQAEATLAVARAALNLAMGLDPASSLSLPEELEPDSAVNGSLEDLVARAHSARPDLAAAEFRSRAAEEMIRVARADYYPQVGIGGNFQVNDNSFLGTNGTNWTVAAVAKWEFFNGFKTASRVTGAEQRARAARHMQELSKQGAELQVRKAYYELRAARQRLVQSKKAIELATLSLRIVEDRYRNGLTTLVELLDAETSLTAARTREVSAQRGLLLSRATLNLAVGQL